MVGKLAEHVPRRWFVPSILQWPSHGHSDSLKGNAFFAIPSWGSGHFLSRSDKPPSAKPSSIKIARILNGPKHNVFPLCLNAKVRAPGYASDWAWHIRNRRAVTKCNRPHRLQSRLVAVFQWYGNRTPCDRFFAYSSYLRTHSLTFAGFPGIKADKAVCDRQNMPGRDFKVKNVSEELMNKNFLLIVPPSLFRPWKSLAIAKIIIAGWLCFVADFGHERNGPGMFTAALSQWAKWMATLPSQLGTFSGTQTLKMGTLTRGFAINRELNLSRCFRHIYPMAKWLLQPNSKLREIKWEMERWSWGGHLGRGSLMKESAEQCPVA